MESKKSFTLIERGKKWWRNQLEEGKLGISDFNYAILLLLCTLSFVSTITAIIAVFYCGYVLGKGLVSINSAVKRLQDLIDQLNNLETKK